MCECAISVSHIIQPLAFVDVAVGVDHFTVAISLVVGPLALVHTAIWPGLDSIAIFAAV